MHSEITVKLKDIIKTEALRLGFSHIGFTRPISKLSFDVFKTWLDNGYAADMQYLSRMDTLEKRADPRKILPSCQTVISFALPYEPANQPTQDQDTIIGRVSSYAQGIDYHNIIPALLEKIMETVTEQAHPLDIEYRIYTDTGPILERAYAQQAGLGWIAKNSCLIIPGFGSYVFLAEILINIDFEPDQPFTKDLCGNCTHCLQACPTTCILTNRTINANRCISYLTIENRQEVPSHLRPQMDNWLFGCDICQQVCPWNKRFAEKPSAAYFTALDDLPNPDLENFQIPTPEEFNQKFRDRPIKRAKRRGFLRNLAVVLGNSKNEAAIPVLSKLAISDPEMLVRLHAIWGLGQFHHHKAKEVLEHAVAVETEDLLVKEIAKYLNI